jgi:hypothetical protein
MLLEENFASRMSRGGGIINLKEKMINHLKTSYVVHPLLKMIFI